jgi:hypothetical protein
MNQTFFIAIMPKENNSRLMKPCLPFAVFHRVNLLRNEVRCPYWNEPDPMGLPRILRALRGYRSKFSVQSSMFGVLAANSANFHRSAPPPGTKAEPAERSSRRAEGSQARLD